MKIAACATRGHIVTYSLFACVHIPRRAIHEAKFFIAEYIEYDFMIALSDSIRQQHTNELHFPRSCIIYLRSTQNTLAEETLQITFSDGQKITYKVPVLKLKNYSINEIFEKNLLILLPYYIINSNFAHKF